MASKKFHALVALCIVSVLALYWVSRSYVGGSPILPFVSSTDNTHVKPKEGIKETEDDNKEATENNKEVEPVNMEMENSKNETGNMVKGAGKMDNVDEKELDELLHVLQSRLDNYNGSLFSWTKKTCGRAYCDTACFDSSCPRQFSPSVRERLKQVLSIRSSLPEKYMPAVRSAARSVTSHKYIFVTGASSNHYGELQYLLHTMFENLLPRFEGEDYALVVYDIGLTKEERRKTEKNCRCTVLDFPFSAVGLPDDFWFPRCFVWRTLLVAAMLEKAEYVMWSDASIRFRQSDPFPKAFHRARDHGMQSRINWGSLGCRTYPSMAKFYGDEICQYSAFTEMEGNLFILHNDSLTWEAVMKPWLTCAVTKNCQCPEDFRHKSWSCTGGGRGGKRTYGSCHRTQSAYGMLLSKLYLEKRPMLHIGGVNIARESKMNWFKVRR